MTPKQKARTVYEERALSQQARDRDEALKTAMTETRLRFLIEQMKSGPVPPTIATDDDFRQVYGQGYRHALADVLALLSEPQAAQEPQIVAVVDGRCGCNGCVERTENIYRMVGVCLNCGAKPILMLFRVGDPAASQDCPICGKWHGVQSQRLATADEIPAAAPPVLPAPPEGQNTVTTGFSSRTMASGAPDWVAEMPPAAPPEADKEP